MNLESFTESFSERKLNLRGIRLLEKNDILTPSFLNYLNKDEIILQKGINVSVFDAFQ